MTNYSDVLNKTNSFENFLESKTFFSTSPNFAESMKLSKNNFAFFVIYLVKSLFGNPP